MQVLSVCKKSPQKACKFHNRWRFVSNPVELKFIRIYKLCLKVFYYKLHNPIMPILWGFQILAILKFIWVTSLWQLKEKTMQKSATCTLSHTVKCYAKHTSIRISELNKKIHIFILTIIKIKIPKDKNANLIFDQKMASGLFCSQAQIWFEFPQEICICASIFLKTYGGDF